MGKAAPSPSNYTGAANQQAAASQANVNQQTQANRPDVQGATQSQQWTQGPDGRWTLTQGYGAAQPLADTLQQQSLDALGQPLDNGTAARNQTIDESYRAATSRLDPEWQQREQLAGSELANMGIDPNSAAAQARRRELSNARTDAYSQAHAAAVREGNAAGSDVFRNNLAARNNPLAQLLALANSSRAPNFNSAGVAQSPELLSAAIGQDADAMRRWQLEIQQASDMVNAGGQLAGTVAKALFSF